MGGQETTVINFQLEGKIVAKKKTTKKATKKAAKKKTTKKAAKKVTKKAAKKTTKKATKKAAKKTTKKAAKKVTKKAAKKTTKKAAKKAAPKKKRKANPALLVPLTPNAALAAVVGNKPLPRGQVMKKIWAYVKSNNLQDPANGQYINSDATLKNLFKKGRVHMTEFGKVLKAPFLT